MEVLRYYIFFCLVISACHNNDYIKNNNSEQVKFSYLLDATIDSVSKDKLDTTAYLQYQKNLNSFDDLNKYKYFYLSALVNNNIKDHERCLYYAKKADSIALKLNQDSLIVKTKLLISKVNVSLNNNNIALQYAFNALPRAHSDIFIYSCNYYIANSYRQMFDYKKALIYYDKATLNNLDTNFLSAIYNNMSLCYEKQLNFNKQKEYLQKIIFINQNQKDKTRLSECYANFGNYYFTVQNLDSAKYCIEKSIELDKEMNYISGENYEIYGRILMGMNKDRESEEAFIKSIKIFREQSIDKLSNPFYGLSDLMRKKKEYIKSLAYMDSASECVISTYKNNIITETKKLEKDYNLKIKDEQIKNLDAERKIVFQRINNQIKFFVLLLILLSFGFIIYIQLQNKKRLVQDIHTLELEQQLLRSQMNPHFIFNSIAGIRGNILNDEKEKAVHYLSKFSKLTRNVLENSSQKAVSIEEDIIILKNYIDLQLMRFDNSFDVEFTIDKNLDTEMCMMPPMLIQPIIENSIEHGFRGLSYRGKLEIVYQLLENNLLEIKIIDNGKGLGKTRHDEVQQMKKQSMSFEITKKRLELWSKKDKRKGNIEINENSSETLTGVTSIIHLSLKFKNE